ncbi:MAG: hypothetical protein HY975_02695, partial [Candidatus Kerfeldbacteria bacterium]|nr:hypothetical protein [Candidatus Kerfeldbacteria bacterium]
GLVAFASRDTNAEFEVPQIDTSNQVALPEFRGVWSYDRGLATNLGVYNGYEALAVGVDRSITTCGGTAPLESCNGIMYFYNGSNGSANNWRRVSSFYPTGSIAGSTVAPYSLNAVSGQKDQGEGTPSPVVAVGADAHIYAIRSYSTQPTTGGSFGSFVTEQYSPALSAADALLDYYAVDAGQLYQRVLLAGGQKGLVAYTTKGPTADATWTRLTPSIRNNDAGETLIGNLPANENITGIKFSIPDVAYVTTSTFNGDAMDRTCAGSQTSHLYKIKNTSDNVGKWTLLKTEANTCYYGLAILTRDLPSGTHGPLQNSIYLATNNGVKKFDEASGVTTTLNTTAGKRYYSVVALQNRSGDGQQLLLNGGFESLTSTPLSASSRADNYYYTGVGNGTHNATSVCDKNTSDMQVVSGGHGGEYAMVVEPRESYPNTSCTGVPDATYTVSVGQTVPLSTIEGKKFRITGWYKVEFPISNVMAQGGVVLACGGSYPPEYTDCSFNNRSLVRTRSNPANSWVNFDITVSREDLIFGPTTNGRGAGTTVLRSRANLTPREMFLDIRCEATYGAKVTCDDLKVEEISVPGVPAVDTGTVLAVGENVFSNGIAFNDDTLSAVDETTRESLPSRIFTDNANGITDTLYGMSAVSPQHIYAVGTGLQGGAPTSGLLLLSRTPSTLTGMIWAGASSATGPTAADRGSIGPISVSCINSRIPPLTGPTLCQLNPDSYGLSLQKRLSGSTFIGSLSGRAWFGKSTTTGGPGGSVD